MSTNEKDENFQITKEEMDKFQKAMENEEFRKLLLEYAQEISDPENKKKYEEEISQMEKERGMDIKFVNPEGGFVVKTTRIQDGVKAFVNICYNEHVQKATSHVAEREENGIRKKGEQWSIPFSLSQPRDDFDNAGKKCVVFDVVFNPETFTKGQQEPRFKELIINTALEGIQNQLNIKLNNKNLKFPKLKFKGVKQATVIRTKSKENQGKVTDNNINIGNQSFPYPYSNEPKQESKKKKNKAKHDNKSNSDVKESKEKDSNGFEMNKQTSTFEPVYRIVHRGVIDFQNFTNSRDSCTSTRPKELLVTIELPQLKSTGTVELDIFEKQLILHNENPDYHLDMVLPYSVDEANGSAKFDKSRRELVITLPVLQPDLPKYTYHPFIDDDSCENEELPQGTNLSKNIEFAENIDNSIKDNSVINCNVINSNEVLSTDDNVVENGKVNGFEHLDNGDVFKDETRTNVEEEFILMDSIDQTDATHNDGTPIDATSSDLVVEMASNLADMPSLFFKSPPYTFHQDIDTITFVIHVAGVSLEDVSLGFNENKCYINFPSKSHIPGHLQDPDYALYIVFPNGHVLSTDNCHIDVSDCNLVLTLAKDDGCKGLWDSFQAGPGEEELEERLFVTDNNVEAMMQEIASQDPWEQQNQYTSDTTVLSVGDNHLTVQLRENKAKGVSDSPNTPVNNHVHLINGDETNMTSVKLENLDLKEGILSNKMQELQLQKLTSPDEGIVHDMYSHERREKYSHGLTERIAASTDPKLVQDHGHKPNTDERRKNRSDSTDSLSSDRSDSIEGRRKSRSDSLDSIGSDRSDLASSTIPMRKSCMRRSSTSTDDDTDYDINNAMSPSNGSWGSPGKRNVRFNLNPSVRVFSNKKDKQRWKLEQRLKNQKLSMRENSEDKQEDTILEEGIVIQDGSLVPKTAKRQDSESSVDEDWTIIDKPQTSLSNHLIFELDE